METPSFEQRMQRIEQLVQRIEQGAEPAVQDAAREMVRTLLDLHAAGLTRMLDLLARADPASSPVLEAWGRDELVRNVLLLHDLHPDDTQTRVQRALEQVRPYLDSHGGGVELLEAADGVVRLRLQGSCHGCPSSTATLHSLIETAIYDIAPEVGMVVVEDPNRPTTEPEAVAQNLVQLQTVVR